MAKYDLRQAMAAVAAVRKKRFKKAKIVLPQVGANIAIREGALTAVAKRSGGYDAKKGRIKVSWLKSMKARLQAKAKKRKLTDAERALLRSIILALTMHKWRKVGRKAV